jgi:hypothetical protein
MRLGYLFYLVLLVGAWWLSIRCRKSDPALRYFPYLMTLTLLTEGSMAFVYFVLHRPAPLVAYHLYQPASYCLYALFFADYLHEPWKRGAVLATIPVYVLSSTLISWRVTGTDLYPGLNYNIEGLLLITLSVITLFSLRVEATVSILRLPVFWICCGLLVFHAGIFFFNFLFPRLLVNNHALARRLQDLLIQNLNYLLYLSFSVAFLCSNRIMKSTLPR